MTNAFSAATPRLTGLTARTFGIELELGFKSSATGSPVAFSTIKEPLLAALAAAGVVATVEGYNHETRPTWKFVPDGSIGYGNIELVSPILSGAAGLAEVEKVCGVLAGFFPFVNETMGYHVHHEARDLDLAACKRLARIVTRFKAVFDGLLPASRRNNTFCRHFDAADLARIERATVKGEKSSNLTTYEGERYRALNFHAINRHGTVEFRQHSGTFEFAKIAAWVLLTQGLVEKAKVFGRAKVEVAPIGATGDGFNALLRTAGLRTCLPHGQKVNPAFEKLVRSVVTTLRSRATKFGLIALTERSENRSRARTAVAAAVATPAPVAAPVLV